MDKEQIPVAEKRRVVVRRTPSLKETFPGRLEWKKKHYDKPVTSTPLAMPRSSKSSTSSRLRERNDVESCFGFDESTDGDEDYSILISPILSQKDKDKVQVEQEKNIIHFKRVPPPGLTKCNDPKVNELFDRYTPDVKEEDVELHVNLKGVKATYCNKHLNSKREVEEEPKRVTRSKSKKSGSSTTTTKSSTVTKTRLKKPKGTTTKTKSSSKNEIDNENDLEQWVAKKNKEFEDISNFPLVLEKSP